MPGQKPLREGFIRAPESNRHKYPWGDHSRTPLVPLETPDARGEICEGLFRIPARLAKTQEHTNERHELDNIIRANFERWITWRRMMGWEWTGERPILSEPFPPPEAGNRKAKQFIARAAGGLSRIGTAEHRTDYEEDPDAVMYVRIWARFRGSPYLKLEDAIAMHELAEKLGVDLTKDFTPETPDNLRLLEGGDSGWVNPLKFAEERRRRRGLRREDYLIGRTGDPYKDIMEPL